MLPYRLRDPASLKEFAALLCHGDVLFNRKYDWQRVHREASEIGRKNGIRVRIDAKRGKGSHITLYYGSQKTVMKDRRKEIGAGLLSIMIRQLGLGREDFL